ncbi:MAG: flagellar basal body rod protein FlgC [Planctomycetaceae bacterium]|nr:flagellar basal body rod protein FlgC [Planctomycetaceae bacterium]
MELGRLLGAADIAASGLSAERSRMDAATRNIANAHVTHTDDGGPYRREEVVLSNASLQPSFSSLQPSFSSLQTLRGVQVVGVEQDASPFPRVFNPGHPDADADGFVAMPNVQIPREMVDLLTASRAYEANLKSLSMFEEMAEQTLSLLRGGR